MLLGSHQAHASLRVYKAKFAGDTYYILALEPIRISGIIVGYTALGANDELGSGVLMEGASNGTTLVQDYSALEFLMFEGPSLFTSPDFQPLTDKERLELINANTPFVSNHVLENYIFNSVEDWALKQYVVRKRIEDPVLLEQVRQETRGLKDGLGWVAILDGNKKILGTIAFAARTIVAPLLPLEARLGIRFAELPLVETSEFPILRKGKLIPEPSTVVSGLSVELKRYIIDRESPIDLLHVLLAFGERVGMSRGMMHTKYPQLYNGRPLPQGVEFRIGRYVMEADPIASRVYQNQPYNFQLYEKRGHDHILMATRDQYLKLWEDNPRLKAPGKVEGKLFLSGAEIMGGIVASPDQRGFGYPTGSYSPKTLHEFKMAWLGNGCESALKNFEFPLKTAPLSK